MEFFSDPSLLAFYRYKLRNLSTNARSKMVLSIFLSSVFRRSLLQGSNKRLMIDRFAINRFLDKRLYKERQLSPFSVYP